MSNNTQPLKTLVQCQNLSKSFNEKNHPTQILQNIDFQLQPKERVAIIGASGSGKSTFLHLLAGLDKPSSGLVSIMDRPFQDYKSNAFNQMRNRYIGFIFQFHHLLPEFTLLENVAMPLLIRGTQRTLAHSEALHTLEKLGLSHRAHHKPTEASGGERQRAAVGRAIITKPAFILADEPTGNLDSQTAHTLIDILCSLDQTGVILVTHDYSVAERMDRILKLENGHLVPACLKDKTL